MNFQGTEDWPRAYVMDRHGMWWNMVITCAKRIKIAGELFPSFLMDAETRNRRSCPTFFPKLPESIEVKNPRSSQLEYIYILYIYIYNIYIRRPRPTARGSASGQRGFLKPAAAAATAAAAAAASSELRAASCQQRAASAALHCHVVSGGESSVFAAQKL